ncbi:MAG: hypothetical protein AAF701_03330 [Pseudomonadota bacterium]
MTTFLPKEVTEGLRAAQKKAMQKSHRLRVYTGTTTVKILKLWDTGFSVDLEEAPRLRGLVDLYDGGRHLYQCLIVASEEQGDVMFYEFKRNTMAQDAAPLDFVRDANAPIALLGSK